MLSSLKKLSFGSHIILCIFIRILLIIYGEMQDSISEVPFTDVDYQVITDGARHVLNGSSPFKRHTYRYTPLLAYAVIPNIVLHKCYGKILFVFFDILVGIYIKKILTNEFIHVFTSNTAAMLEKINKKRGNSKIFKSRIEFKLPQKYIRIAEWSSYIWLYNPLTMVIATRGNGDCISGLLVLLSLYLLLKPDENMSQYFLAGIFHGLAIHVRMYPLIFSLAYYLTISSCKFDTYFDFIKSIFYPNKKQILLVAGTIITLISLTGIFYSMYGYQFLYESCIYHLIRKDTRHNFSLFFYMQYLGSEYETSMLEKVLTISPQIITLLFLTFYFGKHRKTLSFCIFAQTFTMVAYNTVVTSQYFVWFLSLLPLCANNFKKLGLKSAILFAVLWFLSQGGWLLPAYFLEFKGWNTFEFIWLQGIVFFSVNVFILQRLIMNFDVISDFRKTM